VTPKKFKEYRNVLFQEGFTFKNFVVDAFTIFVFIVWFWLLISVASDLFRRHDISGWAKAIWVIVLIVAPYIGVLAYLIFQGSGIGERNLQQAPGGARETPTRGFSAADEIEKLDRLKKAGSISAAEFASQSCGGRWQTKRSGKRLPPLLPNSQE
jgi:hypothetical protein